MKKEPIYILIVFAVFVGGIGLGWYIRNQTLNPKAAIPSVFERTLNFIIQKGEKEDNDLLYYDTNFSDFIVYGSAKTKIAVEGVVDKITKQPDGDYHIIMRPQYVPTGLYLVTEAIPEIKSPLPKVGDKIKIWGIVRFDLFHNWWEIHPIVGWEEIR